MPAEVFAQAGKLRKRLTLQVNQPSAKDNFGAWVDNWVDVATVYASVEPISGREFFNAAQIQSDITHRIRMRVRKDLTVTPDMRLKFGTRIFHFAAPPRDLEELGVVWELMAVEATG